MPDGMVDDDERMKAAVLRERIAEASPRFKARMAGVLSLLGLLAAVFGEFFVRRLEFAGDLIAVSGNGRCDALKADEIAFYRVSTAW